MDEPVVVADPDGWCQPRQSPATPNGVAAVAYHELPPGVDVEVGLASLADLGMERPGPAHRRSERAAGGLALSSVLAMSPAADPLSCPAIRPVEGSV